MSDPAWTRRFLAPDAVMDSWSRIEPYFDLLEARSIDSVADLVTWIEDYSELVAAVDEVGTDRHVKMTCRTDDPECKAAFLDFLEHVEPRCKSRCHGLNVKYVECAVSGELPTDRYGVLDRSIRASVELFREENLPLQTEEAKRSQQYQEACGAQMVNFEGKEQTLQQLALYAERTDRELRQKAWVAEAERRAEDVEVFEDIFDEMIKLRHQMALNAGCMDYREYAFKAKQRFDYTAQDCLAFHEAVAKAAVPAFRDMQRARRDALGFSTLRPWDQSVDVLGRPPLRPFTDADDLCDRASRVFHRVDGELGDQFDEMRDCGYLDLTSRKGKAPGGYQATYDESRHPFIFMNAVGVQRDVRTLIHEGGHAFHCFAARHDPILSYRSSPIEFAEVASFGMEMLSLDRIDEFYDGDGLARAQRAQLEGIVSLFPWIATIDAFQHFLYANPDHSRDDRRAHWLELRERFGGIADYTGYEQVLAYSWQRQPHLFDVPFYYIEYGIAKLGALQIWANAKKDFAGAVTAYRAALELGGSRTLPELFEAAGARFDFSYETLAPLVELLQDELAKLPQ